MVKKYSTQEQIKSVIRNGMEELKKNDIDVKENEFTVIQSYSDGQGIVFKVEENEEGKRKTKIEVSDTLIVLPPITDGTLDIFASDSDN